MIELLFTACLASTPGICEEKSLTFVDVTPMACMMGAQPELAKWQTEHPKFTVQGWKCRAVNLNAQNA
ncbi:hypothetical protein HJ526_13735 [Donghicola sp. C2-DW-16]|uniref:Uncharacterized protein n=1 Tax=Donghicola mangrovi TaxID=2729614 RepID=A0A850Q1Z0_9RHOB|nr:hypothetical protein [Donghicola mangrovi]NVO23106.1 hypothetical protein [Donghicola mangrovi]NVO28487.1 hypothetical protein [Donghicola mangrovi]